MIYHLCETPLVLIILIETMSDRSFMFKRFLQIARIMKTLWYLFAVRTHRRTGSHGNTPFNPADLVTNPPAGSDVSHPQLHHTVTAPGQYQAATTRASVI